MSLTATEGPTVYGMGAAKVGIPGNNIVFTWNVAASSSITAGDFIKLTSTTAGTVESCTATSDTIFGIALQTKDNSTGAAGDLLVPVLHKGVTEVDGIVCASGTYDEPIRINDILYLTGSAVASSNKGQVLTSTTDTGVGTKKIARALDSVSTPATSYTLSKIRVYVDFLGNNLT